MKSSRAMDAEVPVGKPFRRATDIGLDRTVEWIGRWYGDLDDLNIEQVTLACPCIHSITRSKLRRLAGMCKGNESFLHTYIKFCAWVAIYGMTDRHDLVAWECLYYTPYIDHPIIEIDDFNTQMVIPVHEPQAFVGSIGSFRFDWGQTYRVDVRSAETVMEIGGTQPLNLIMPLLDGLADRSIWIPYPTELKAKEFSLSRGALGDLTAYSFSLANQAASRDILRRSFRKRKFADVNRPEDISGPIVIHVRPPIAP